MFNTTTSSLDGFTIPVPSAAKREAEAKRQDWRPKGRSITGTGPSVPTAEAMRLLKEKAAS